MMTNPWRGEVAIIIDGEQRTMRLTLGSLAELEANLGSDSLVGLVQRFEDGACTTRDVLALIVAGLRGAGWTGDAQDLLNAQIEGGPLAAARAAAELLRLTFTLPDDSHGAPV